MRQSYHKYQNWVEIKLNFYGLNALAYNRLYNSIMDWCLATCGLPFHWNQEEAGIWDRVELFHTPGKFRFAFKHAEDAMAFRLRWSDYVTA